MLSSRFMGWLPVALSILATDTSATTYFGQPAWVFAHDMKLNQVMLGCLVAIAILILVFLSPSRTSSSIRPISFWKINSDFGSVLLTSAFFVF